MNYAHLGSSGLKVSRLCLGMMTYGDPTWRPWILSEEQARPFVHRAIDVGMNFFDTADMYSLGKSEEVLGRAIRDVTSRDRVVIATKAYYPMSSDPNDRGLSRKHLLSAIDNSLRRLGTDYVDLYQIHRWDAEVTAEEVLRTLDDIVRSGKARYIGASSMPAWQFARALYTADRHGWSRFVSMQNHYNLIYREEEREMIPLCLEEGIGVIPWSPLARGFLAGNRKRGSHSATAREESDTYGHDLYYADADYDVADRVVEIAHERGAAPVQIALAWLLRKPGVTSPIVGATTLQQLDQLIEALAITLSDDEMRRLEEPYRPHDVLGM